MAKVTEVLYRLWKLSEEMVTENLSCIYKCRFLFSFIEVFTVLRTDVDANSTSPYELFSAFIENIFFRAINFKHLYVNKENN